MYRCPLCTTSDFYYATLESLSSHIDNVHCLITGPTRLSNEIKILENQIGRFLDLELKSDTTVRPRQFLRDVNEPGQWSQYQPKVGFRTKLNEQKQDLLTFPKDYEYVKLENSYLKQRLRELERRLHSETETLEEKSFNLQKDLQNVTSFVQNTQREQQRSKQHLQRFLADLLSDLDEKEKLLAELSEQVQEKKEEQYAASLENPLNIPGTSNLSRFPTTISLRTRKPSGQSVDSGYYDGAEFSAQKRPASFHQQASPIPKIAHSTDRDIVGPQSFFESPLGVNQEVKKSVSTSESVLGRVFTYLDTITLLKCSLVCRKWKKVAEYPIFWRKINIQRFEISSKQLKKLSNYCAQTNRITLQELRIRDNFDSRKSGKGFLEQGLESVFKVCGEFLTFLKIVDCSPFLTDRSLWLASCYCRNLKQIIYSSQNFNVSAPVLWSMGASCRKVETLIFPLSKNYHPAQDGLDNVGNGLRFDDNCLLMIARCWPTTLKYLSFVGSFVTISGLAQIAEHCEILEKLEVENFPELTLVNVQNLCKKGFKFVQNLHFLQTKIKCDGVLHFIAHLSRLSKILLVWQTDVDHDANDYLSEIFELQKLKDSNPNVDKTLHIVLRKSSTAGEQN